MLIFLNLLGVVVAVVAAGFLMRPKKGWSGARSIFKVLRNLVITGVACLISLVSILVVLVLVLGASDAVFGDDSAVGLNTVMSFSPAQLMVPALVLLCLAGVLTAWVHRLTSKRFPSMTLSPVETDFAEYIIQWTTIYLTVYQLVFETISDAAAALTSSDQIRVVVDVIMRPENINMTILPLLFAAWIAIALEKLYVNYGSEQES